MDQTSFITSFIGNIVSAVQNGFQMAAKNQELNSEATALKQRYNIDSSLLKLQASQIDMQAANEINQRQKQAERERAKMLVAMGDAGLSGNSVLRSMSASLTDQSVDTDVIDANRQNNLQQNQATQEAAKLSLDSQLNKIESQKTSFLEGFAQTSSTLSGGTNFVFPILAGLLKKTK